MLLLLLLLLLLSPCLLYPFPLSSTERFRITALGSLFWTNCFQI